MYLTRFESMKIQQKFLISGIRAIPTGKNAFRLYGNGRILETPVASFGHRHQQNNIPILHRIRIDSNVTLFYITFKKNKLIIEKRKLQYKNLLRINNNNLERIWKNYSSNTELNSKIWANLRDDSK